MEVQILAFLRLVDFGRLEAGGTAAILAAEKGPEIAGVCAPKDEV